MPGPRSTDNGLWVRSTGSPKVSPAVVKKKDYMNKDIYFFKKMKIPIIKMIKKQNASGNDNKRNKKEDYK